MWGRAQSEVLLASLFAAWRDFVRMRKEHTPQRQSFRHDWTKEGGWRRHDEETFADESLRIDRAGGPRTVGGSNVPLPAHSDRAPDALHVAAPYNYNQMHLYGYRLPLCIH